VSVKSFIETGQTFYEKLKITVEVQFTAGLVFTNQFTNFLRSIIFVGAPYLKSGHDILSESLVANAP
jgi:hypothetical protein